MPKRSKIVSGKVIAAVEQSRKKLIADSKVEEKAVEVTSEKVESGEVMISGDVRARFQQRKEELEANRHASDPKNIRKAEKRRADEEKKKTKNSKHQSKKLDDSSASSKGSEASLTESDAKRAKSGIEEGDFVFSRVADSDKNDSKTKKLASSKVISNPKQALQKLQAEKEKLEKLRSTNIEKASALQEKIELKKALQKAQGIAVKDDVNLLKKSIQRREKEKNKSRENWNNKKSELQETKDKRQAKRNENIQARIDAKKNKKMGIKVKKTQKSGKSSAQKGKFNKKK